MKKTLLLSACAALLCGCADVQYTNGPVSVASKRFLWSTQAYEITISTNGIVSMKCGGSKADSEGVGSAIGAGISAYQKTQTGGL
jgi:hypothetical protein